MPLQMLALAQMLFAILVRHQITVQLLQVSPSLARAKRLSLKPRSQSVGKWIELADGLAWWVLRFRDYTGYSIGPSCKKNEA
jgi:hypothetical protein